MAPAFDQRAELAQQRARRVRLIQTAGISLTLVVTICVAIIVLAKQTRVTFEDGASAGYSLHMESGWGFSLFNRIVSFDSQATVSVVARGYITQTVAVNSSKRGKFLDVFMPLAPVALEVHSTVPLETPNWFVDGDWVGSSPSLLTELNPGRYVLTLSSLFTEDLQLEVELQKAEPSTLEVSPTLLQGRLELDSTPSGASVEIDGTVKGVTPLSIEVRGGRYALELSKDEYQSQYEKIEITGLKPVVTRNYKLQVGTNSVQLSLSPPDGRLQLNGRPHSNLKEITVPTVGHVELTYQKPGYASKSVQVLPQDRRVAISLEPTFGKVAITANVTAAVFVDGVAKGQTPITLSLPTVSYNLELKRDGYLDAQQNVTVLAEQTVVADFTLRTRKQASLETSPSKVNNSLGMSLLRFLPTEFMLGAPRSERGQQAHEIQRRVTFDRHIYVATHEVTEAAYALFKGQQSSSKLPARNISWDDAARFCNWLSEREGLPSVYTLRNNRVVAADLSATGYRLPTEAEWEWLAKAANKPAPTVFVWGNAYQIPEQSGNLADISAKGKASVFLSDYSDGFAELAPIGSFKAERSGLFDMVGNVSEWVHDTYARTPADANQTFNNYAGPSSMQGEHVIKGSNYLSQSWTELRAAMRLAFREANGTTGFRVARYVY